jgi:hypothetical protein
MEVNLFGGILVGLRIMLDLSESQSNRTPTLRNNIEYDNSNGYFTRICT